MTSRLKCAWSNVCSCCKTPRAQVRCDAVQGSGLLSRATLDVRRARGHALHARQHWCLAAHCQGSQSCPASHCGDERTLSLSQLTPASSLSLSVPASRLRGALERKNAHHSVVGHPGGISSRCCVQARRLCSILSGRASLPGAASRDPRVRFTRPKGPLPHLSPLRPLPLCAPHLRSRGVDVAGGGDGVGGQQGRGGLGRGGEEHAQRDLGPGEEQPQGVDAVHVGVVDGGAVDLRSSRGPRAQGSGGFTKDLLAPTHQPHVGQANNEG